MAQLRVTTLDARLLVAEAMLPRLTHLAVGDGVVVAAGALVAPDPAAHGLIHEIGRTLFLQRFFVERDDDGTLPVGGSVYRPAVGVSNHAYFRFRFQAPEAHGNWSEWALCGGDVAYIARGATLLDGPQGGDDRAGVDVTLGGGYAAAENQTLTLTVTVGGGSGAAHVGWASTGSEPPGAAAIVFGAPTALGATGLTVTFTGGGDAVLTAGDQWIIHGTRSPDTAEFASGGVYDPIGNEAGQVAQAGTAFEFYHVDPPDVKGATIVDVQLVVDVLKNG